MKASLSPTVQDQNGQKEQSVFSAPTISLSKGGGAIHGMGEKFAANPVTGTGVISVPIAVSPGRSGFGPQLSLSYDSGSGNGPFGFGWSLSLPAITRKTDKGLPQYLDAEESDVYILSGAEDLVPLLRPDGVTRFVDTTSVPGYAIHRYRPRIEGLFARIECWTHTSGDVHWRSITKDNLTTLYGKENNSRVFDPAHRSHIFTWLICESYDDKGNHIVYTYAGENALGVDLAQAHERNRPHIDNLPNRYIKRIQYGNRVSRLVSPQPADPDWMFEVVFDYGEGHYTGNELDAEQHFFAQAQINPPDGTHWPVRPDPFSTYRAGFEVRTYRRCQRVLMFHHFAELGANPCLVRSTEFEYADLDYLHTPMLEIELAHQGSTRYASFIQSATQPGYVRQALPGQLGRYLKKSLPPLEFEYSKATILEDIREVDAASLENLPIGLDGSSYQWVDLDGEGLSGILTEQADAWFYKRNLGDGHFGPLEQVSTKPSLAALSGGRQQLLDLAGDGQLDVVAFAGPMPGFFERTPDEGWETFIPFKSLPNLNWNDPNLRFVDLNGDGHADVLITEHEALTWYPSLAEDGFAAAKKVRKPLDEEQGPRLVFADGVQSIYLADMSADGLTDLVRIRNGEVSYWPNLGYGRFGARVVMDNAPWFDAPDQFNQKHIRLADIDGSGATDIIYLGHDGVRLYFNQSGNRWSAPRALSQFPQVDNLSSVMTADLLGNGTACLVWSSSLSGDVCHPLRFIDLMGGQKPHLMIKSINNLGAETRIQYAPSTKFYLADKLAGKPWVTRIPFPVHCVEKVTVTDKWRKATFTSTYSYHHGYFDGVEREFRGFGRVEQVDIEAYSKFRRDNAGNPHIAENEDFYQPPVKTVTWHHTGAVLDRDRILSQFAHEYFPRGLTDGAAHIIDGFDENALPEPDLTADGLSADEWREALRACKGMMLRQEIYELDARALEGRGAETPVKLFSAAMHNCHIQKLQGKASNRHAVFLVTESEAITYHYELDLKSATLTPDPRIAHSLNLATDEYGNILQAVAVVYPRIRPFEDETLAPADVERIRSVQREMHIAYTENRYTDDLDDANHHRLRVPCEVLTYELTHLRADANDHHYFSLNELRRLPLSAVYQREDEPVEEIAYHILPSGSSPQKRCVEHTRTLFFMDNLDGPLALGHLGLRGLVYETYTLALTTDLLNAIFDGKLAPGSAARTKLDDPAVSGYSPALDAPGQYWKRSGIPGFADDDSARDHFFLPEHYTDPFGNVTTLAYDPFDLYVQSSVDARGNTTRVTRFDYRVLAPREIMDANDNLSEVCFDVLGLPAAMALEGKGAEADNLAGFDDTLINPNPAALAAFFQADVYDEAAARGWLGNATARHVYHFGEVRNPDGSISWGVHPACACGILREQHLSLGRESPLQVAFEYSDGAGNLLVKKVQAEPENAGQALRWIANGKTILNNKGKPVMQYEPYFSENGPRFEELREVGVTPILHYDAPGRQVRTESPDGSYSHVEFSPWQVATYDANDTVLEPDNRWYPAQNPLDPNHPLPTRHTGELLATPRQRAAWLAAQHANTPALTVLDSLGRNVVAVAHNKFRDQDNVLYNEKYVTFTKLDAEGKPLWIRDARGNLVMQYIMPLKPTRAADEPDPTNPEHVPVGSAPCYDIAGNLLFQHSMDAGKRWTLMDAAGKPMLAWDVNDRLDEVGTSHHEQRLFFTRYDALHRPLETQLTINMDAPRVIERFTYGESLLDVAQAKAHNLRGQAHQHYDSSGLMTYVRYDFKGNLLEAQRRLAADVRVPILDWTTAALEDETFMQLTEYDALKRMTRQYNWHSTTPDSHVALYEPAYNARGLLTHEDLTLHITKRPGGYDPSHASQTRAIVAIAYDAKGQKQFVEYGNHTITRYFYDPETFRLAQLRTTRAGFDRPFPDFHSNLNHREVLQQLNYTYDPVGNITEIYDEAFKPAFFQNQDVKPQSRYVYDALYRLIAANGRESGMRTGAPPQIQNNPDFEGNFSDHHTDPNALRNYTQQYQYDSVGNIMQMQHAAGDGSWTRHYIYADDSNRLLETWYGNHRDEAVHYEYDLHGSMLNLDRTANAFRLRWDYRDMIQTVKLDDQRRAYYNYDAKKERTRKVIVDGNARQECLYLGGMEIYRSYDSRGQITGRTETHHLFLGDQRVLIVDDVLQAERADYAQGTHFRYQYSNHLGSSCAELDQAAALITYEEYHPYGTSAYQAGRSTAEVNLKRYRYTGKERDAETGLNYHSARYYAPWLGRWVSTDPAGMVDGFNLYIYTQGNPISGKDDTGFETISEQRINDLRNFITSSEVSHQISRGTYEAVIAEAQGGQFPRSGRGHIERPAYDHWESAEGAISGVEARLRALRSELRGLNRNSPILRSAREVIELAQAHIALHRDVGRLRERLRLDYRTELEGIPLREGGRTSAGLVSNQVRENHRQLVPVFLQGDPEVADIVRRVRSLPDATGAQQASRIRVILPPLPSPSPTRVAATTANVVDELGPLARSAGRRVLMAIPIVDVVTQQVTYEDSAYTGYRTTDALLNVTIAETWEIPMAVYSVGELAAHGVMRGIRATGDAAHRALNYLSREVFTPMLSPIDRSIRSIYQQ